LTPWRPGGNYLFTRELYEQCRKKLRPEGMVVHWLPMMSFKQDALKSAVATFQSVFPHVSLWERNHYLGMFGTKHEYVLDMQRFESAVASASVQDDLRRWDLADPYLFLSHYLMGEEEARAFAGGAELSTQDSLAIEFSRLNLARKKQLRYSHENLAALLEHRRFSLKLSPGLDAGKKRKLMNCFKARGYALRAALHQIDGKHALAYENLLKAHALNPRDEIAKSELPRYRRKFGGSGDFK